MNVKRRPIGILPIYNTIELALWSWLISIVILFVAFVLPRLPELRQQQEPRASYKSRPSKNSTASGSATLPEPTISIAA